MFATCFNRASASRFRDRTVQPQVESLIGGRRLKGHDRVSEALGELLRYLKGTRNAVVPALSRFDNLDPTQLASDLDVADKGSARGSEDLPATEERSDTVEHEIRSRITQTARRSIGEFNNLLKLYDERLAEAAIEQQILVRVDEAAKHGLSMYKAEVSGTRVSLRTVREYVAETRADYVSFRSRHRLGRPADLVSSDQRLFRYFIVGIVMVAETVVNGVFFAQGSTGGIIGGVGVAAGLSFLNVVVAAVSGRYATRYLRHVSIAARAFAALTLIASLAGALALNAFIAHYRDLYVVNEGVVPLAAVLDNLTTRWAVFLDTNSLILFALGLTFHGMAVISFFGMDDPYPGYAKVSLARDTANGTYATEHAEAMNRLTAHKERSSSEMMEILDEFARRRRDYGLALQSRMALISELDAHMAHLRECAIQVMTIYREANRRARRTAPPKFFAEAPRLDLPERPHPHPPPLTSSDEKLEEAVKTMREYIERINAEYQSALDSVESIELEGA